jgi:hypothetical protein
MARLNVQAAVRWASGAPSQVIAAQPTFQPIPMLLALSVTDQDGAMVEQLPADAIRVGYQEQPEPSEDSLALVSSFHRHGPSFGGTGWYSCIVKPQSPNGWVQDEVFLSISRCNSGLRLPCVLLPIEDPKTDKRPGAGAARSRLVLKLLAEAEDVGLAHEALA